MTEGVLAIKAWVILYTGEIIEAFLPMSTAAYCFTTETRLPKGTAIRPRHKDSLTGITRDKIRDIVIKEPRVIPR